jgi:hypothetical protein
MAKLDYKTWSGVAYGNGIYVACGPSIAYSHDGLNWTQKDIGMTRITKIVYGNGIFVGYGAIYNNGHDDQYIIHSTDGINWTKKLYTVSQSSISSIQFINNMFVVYFGSLNMGMSTNGIDWTIKQVNSEFRGTDIAYGNGIYVYTNYSGFYGYSTDLINWTGGIKNTSYTFRGQAAFDGEKFVAASAGGNIYTTTDGLNWTKVGYSTGRIEWITYHDGIYVVVGLNNQDSYGFMAYSTDLVNWTKFTNVQDELGNRAGGLEYVIFVN